MGEGLKQTACCAPKPVNPCGEGNKVVGQFSEWCGKVSVHTDKDGKWMVDSDCSSGCNQDSTNYCKKFYPDATKGVSVAITPEDKPFTNAGCSQTYMGPGLKQTACCAPEVVDPCGAGKKSVGQYAEWCGKVSVHTDKDGKWVVDSDCSSGCNQNPMNYCKKFYPEATSGVAMTVTSEDKPFTNAGCSQTYMGPGLKQTACCVDITPP